MPNPNRPQPPVTDAQALDAIASLLGLSSEWDSEYLEHIADIVGLTTRPHPGNTDAADYADAFTAATGRLPNDVYDVADAD